MPADWWFGEETGYVACHSRIIHLVCVCSMKKVYDEAMRSRGELEKGHVVRFECLTA